MITIVPLRDLLSAHSGLSERRMQEESREGHSEILSSKSLRLFLESPFSPGPHSSLLSNYEQPDAKPLIR